MARIREITALIGALAIAACLATLPASLKAQQIVLGSPDRVSGSGIQAIDLQKDASAEELNAARTAYQRGHIIRMTGGTPADLRRSIGAQVFEIRPEAGSKADQQSAAPDASTEILAVRLGQHGELHQFTSAIPNNASRSSLQTLQASFEQWRQKQTEEAVDDPSGPPQAWQEVLEMTYVANGDWGMVQNLVTAYRLSAPRLDGEYYMVVSDPTTSPNFKVPASNCASAFLTDCGWYTTDRNIKISTDPAGTLFDHGPTTQITTGSGSWTIGLGIPATGSIGYTQNWSQNSVTTTDQSNLTAGIAQWDEAFTSESYNTQLPATSTSTFLSHQGAIFKLPPGTPSFQLNVNIDTKIVYQPAFGSLRNGEAGSFMSGTVSPPQLAVNPTSITIAPGTSATIQLVADVAGGKLGLPWLVSNIPVWLNVSQTSGAVSTLLTLTPSPGTSLGTLGTLNFNTDPPFASPNVQTGPLTMNVKVGQPDLHGVLLVGGATRTSSVDTVSKTALLYGVKANQFTGVSILNQARYYHTATLLDDGTILVAGGLNEGNTHTSALATAEIYDPSTGNFSPLATACPGAKGCMVTAGYQRTATKLANGKVLIMGGLDVYGTPLAAAEIYDPATQSFVAVGNMLTPRTNHTATLLPTGEVLVVGGFKDTSGSPATTAELFDPAINSFRLTTGNPVYIPNYGTATLTSGVVLFTGGSGAGGAVASAQVYSVASGTFQAITNMNQARAFHTATLLEDGRVLIAGGNNLIPVGNNLNGTNLDTAEIFDPAAQTFTLVSGSNSCPGAAGCLLTPRSFHTANALVDGRVFLSGGVTGDTVSTLTTTEIFDPATMTFSAGPTFEGRVFHTATVVRAPSTTTIQSSPNPSTPGQQVHLTATVTVPGTEPLSGMVTFYDSKNVLGTAPLANGTATFNAPFNLGQHPISAAYGGNELYGPSTSSPLLQQVNINPTSLTLTSSPNPSQFGALVTFNARLTGQGTATPTGNVSFYDNGSVIGTAPVTQGSAKLPLSTLSAGDHQITAAYPGDSNYAPANSKTLVQTVTGVASQVAISSSTNPATFGASVVFTAKVIVPQTPGTAPTGKVVFADGGTPISSATLTNGAAVLTTSHLALGSHQITANYNGDSTYAPNTSPALTQVVNNALTQTSTTLSSSPNPSSQGQSVSFTATVRPTAGTTSTPTGNVTFQEGSSTLGTGALTTQGGVQVAVFSTSALTAGTHMITAAYSGDSNFANSNSSALTQVVSSPSGGCTVKPTVDLTIDGGLSSTIQYGDTATFVARVHAAPNYPWPDGSITISDSTNANIRYGSGVLVKDPNSNDGLATITNSALAVGSYSLVGTYGGDDQGKYYCGAMSNTVSLGITPKLGGPLPPSIAIDAAVGLRNGTQVPVNLTVTNNGAVPVNAVTLNQITFRTLAGTGDAALVSPSTPLLAGSLQPGQSDTIVLKLQIPMSVQKLALVESGTFQDVGGTVYQFSPGQVVFP